MFQSLERADFGVITRTGSCTASFEVDPFGYESIKVTTPRVASGTVTRGAVDLDSVEGNIRFTLATKLFVETEEIIPGRFVSGTGLNYGYRVASFDGRNIGLKSADLTPGEATAEYVLDTGFTSINQLEDGIPVYGENIPAGATIGSYSVDGSQKKVTLVDGNGIGIANFSAVTHSQIDSCPMETLWLGCLFIEK